MPQKQMKKWRWEKHRCDAHTKGEARSIFKRLIGLDRLPIGAFVVQLSSPERIGK